MLVDFLRDLDGMKDVDMSKFSIKRACLGGGLVPPELAKRCLKMGIDVGIGYGCTQTGEHMSK